MEIWIGACFRTAIIWIFKWTGSRKLASNPWLKKENTSMVGALTNYTSLLVLNLLMAIFISAFCFHKIHFIWELPFNLPTIDWVGKKVTILYSRFLIVKSSVIMYFFTCILLDYVTHEMTKDFWKNSHFKKMIAGFLQRCQNTPRWNTPEMMHFQA